MGYRRTVIGIAAVLVAALLSSGAAFAQDEFGKWVSIFNGKDLTGWQNARDPGAENQWIVQDGALTNRKRGVNDIATTDSWRDFELHVEYKTVRRGNSGVYLRGRVEVQILDSFGKKEVGDGDAGGVYGQHAPKVNSVKRAGEWNSFDIRLIDNMLHVVHNGKTIHDNVMLTDVTGGALPGALNDSGPLMFQGDHGKVWFRNIKIRPLFGPGWRRLFNLKDFTGWKSREGGEPEWVVENGVMTNGKDHDGTDVMTEEDFGDFLVHYEYKAPGNSGVFLRDLWELQINRSYGKRKPGKHDDGALYDLIAPRVLACKKAREWNVMEVKVVGRKITAYQNGVLIHENSECSSRTYDTSDSSNMDAPGPFRLQGDHGRVWFTNFWVKPL